MLKLKIKMQMFDSNVLGNHISIVHKQDHVWLAAQPLCTHT